MGRPFGDFEFLWRSLSVQPEVVLSVIGFVKQETTSTAIAIGDNVCLGLVWVCLFCGYSLFGFLCRFRKLLVEANPTWDK